jgi:hypothetical protein
VESTTMEEKELTLRLAGVWQPLGDNGKQAWKPGHGVKDNTGRIGCCGTRHNKWQQCKAGRPRGCH